MILELLIVILTGLAVIVPFIIPLIEKKDKLKKTVYLIELIKTRDELCAIIEKSTKDKKSPILVDKLNKNLQEIENDINSSTKRFKIDIFHIIISLEIFSLFSILRNDDIQKQISEINFLEGIFASTVVRVVLLLIIIISGYLIAMYTTKKINLKEKITKLLYYNIVMIGVFNIVIVVIGILMYYILWYSDLLTNYF